MPITAQNMERLQHTVFNSPYRLVEDKLAAIWNSAFSQLPNILGALFLLTLAWLATRLLRRWINTLTRRRRREDLGGLLGSIATITLMTLAVLISAAIAPFSKTM